MHRVKTKTKRNETFRCTQTKCKLFLTPTVLLSEPCYKLSILKIDNRILFCVIVFTLQPYDVCTLYVHVCIIHAVSVCLTWCWMRQTKCWREGLLRAWKRYWLPPTEKTTFHVHKWCSSQVRGKQSLSVYSETFIFNPRHTCTSGVMVVVLVYVCVHNND